MNGPGHCRYCWHQVIWAFTQKGKLLALDPAPDPKGNQAAYRDARPAWLTRQLKDDEEPAGYERRFMPHVATCPGPPKPQAPAPLPDNVIPITRARRHGQPTTSSAYPNHSGRTP